MDFKTLGEFGGWWFSNADVFIRKQKQQLRHICLIEDNMPAMNPLFN